MLAGDFVSGQSSVSKASAKNSGSSNLLATVERLVHNVLGAIHVIAALLEVERGPDNVEGAVHETRHVLVDREKVPARLESPGAHIRRARHTRQPRVQEREGGHFGHLHFRRDLTGLAHTLDAQASKPLPNDALVSLPRELADRATHAEGHQLVLKILVDE
jgi:hypothetical protein